MNKVELANKLYKQNHSRKKNTKSSATTGKKFENNKDLVALSSKAISLNEPKETKKSSDIRIDLVNKYKDDINKGNYKIKTDEIADKMIQKYKEQIYYKSFS